MSNLILGAGVIGSALAYYLVKQGQEVTVLDRQEDVALETSFANAGQISPGYASPWAAPGVPFKAIKWLLQDHAPLALKIDGSLDQIIWITQFLKNCSNSRYSINKERMLRLANYSKDCLVDLRQELNLNYDSNSLGTLQIFRTQKQVDSVIAKDIPVLQNSKIHHKMLNKEEIQQVEPALKEVIHKITGALHLPNDETGDCYMFTKTIADKAKDLGANFKLNLNIEQLLIKYVNGKKKVYGVIASDHNGKRQEVLADNVIIALGSYSKSLLKGLVDIPVYPIKGYSITADINNFDMAPQSTILDETYKVAITRLNKRIRVGGMAHISGYNLHLDSKKIDTLNFILHDLFPQAYNETKDGWTALRPATPDGTPIIGNTNIDGLFISTGHGTLGWTMACGSGKLLSDIILGKQADIRYDDLSVSRY